MNPTVDETAMIHVLNAIENVYAVIGKVREYYLEASSSFETKLK